MSLWFCKYDFDMNHTILFKLSFRNTYFNWVFTQVNFKHGKQYQKCMKRYTFRHKWIEKFFPEMHSQKQSKCPILPCDFPDVFSNIKYKNPDILQNLINLLLPRTSNKKKNRIIFKRKSSDLNSSTYNITGKQSNQANHNNISTNQSNGSISLRAYLLTENREVNKTHQEVFEWNEHSNRLKAPKKYPCMCKRL